jgi:hypothetical protein
MRKGYNQQMSDYYLENGSYFRVQNMQLSYRIPGRQVAGIQAPDITLLLTAERPITLFEYNGFNPEVPDGIDRQTYPVPAVYTVGLNLKF